MPEYKPINAESSVTDEICFHLYELAKSMTSIVEVGSWKGKTAHTFLSGCKGRVWCVDHFQGSAEKGDATHGKSGKEEFMKNCGAFPNLTLMEMPSNQASKEFEDESVDMVFIDAGHMYDEILDDLRCWYPKTKVLICGHDYNYDTVKKALSDYNLEVTEPAPHYWEHFKKRL